MWLLKNNDIDMLMTTKKKRLHTLNEKVKWGKVKWDPDDKEEKRLHTLKEKVKWEKVKWDPDKQEKKTAYFEMEK